MPNQRISMNQIQRILELHFVHKLSVRAIARQVGVGRSTVSRLLERARTLNLSWPLPEQMTDPQLQECLYPSRPSPTEPREVPDWQKIHLELIRHKSLTLWQLWEEYQQQHPDGYGYSWFCELYRKWRGAQANPVMRQVHKAGERVFVDYSGKRPEIVDPRTGEVKAVELFVAVLGASNYLYAEATSSQKTADFCGSVRRMFEFFGGIPTAIVPDNLKAAVKRVKRDDAPELNDSFRELTEHYGVEVLPARPYKPRDKGKVESAVLQVQRQVLAPLRKLTFYSLQELNEAIHAWIHELNRAPFQKREGTRRSWFEQIDQPALRPLPENPYEYRIRFHRTVHVDYHIRIERNFYSVPHQYFGAKVWGWLGEHTVEIYLGEERIASHPRGPSNWACITNPAHMPDHHRERKEWSPARFIHLAQKIGPRTEALITANLDRYAIPEQAYRRCLAILNMASKYGHPVLEKACRIALNLERLSAQKVKVFCQRIAQEHYETHSRHIEHENIGAYIPECPRKF